MSKKRTSISVDEDVYEFLQQPQINQSKLIQELVREYETNEQRQVAALRMRLKHLNDDIEDMEGELQTKKKQRAEVKSLLNEAESDEIDGLQEAREAMKGIDESDLTENNPAVENWARKLDMSPSTLLERL